jgi:hypothetical protein
MATFSTNQTRQLYVATAGNNTVFNKDTEDDKPALKHVYLTQINATKDPVRSDLIDPKNVLWVKYTPAADMARKLKTVTVTLDPAAHDEELTPNVGQDYILRINFRQFASLGDQDTYVKHGAVRIFKGMTASDFYREMAISLAKNFSRELTKLVEIKLSDGTVVKPSDTKKTLTGTYTSLVIEEVEQEWTLGIKPQEAVYFDVIPATIAYSGEELTWGVTVNGATATPVGNGKLIAGLEYFCMGERGDMYRGIGWPNTIPTKYLVDENKTYDVIDIHYAYVGSNESVQKSEKTLTIVGETADLADIKSDIETALGVTL